MSQFKTFCIGLALMIGISLNAMASEKLALASKKAPESTMGTCIVCGAKIVDTKACPHMEYDNKDVLFCCKNCMEKFMKDPKKYMSKETKPAAIPTPSKEDYTGTTPSEEEPVDD